MAIAIYSDYVYYDIEEDQLIIKSGAWGLFHASAIDNTGRYNWLGILDGEQ